MHSSPTSLHFTVPLARTPSVVCSHDPDDAGCNRALLIPSAAHMAGRPAHLPLALPPLLHAVGLYGEVLAAVPSRRCGFSLVDHQARECRNPVRQVLLSTRTDGQSLAQSLPLPCACYRTGALTPAFMASPAYLVTCCTRGRYARSMPCVEARTYYRYCSLESHIS
jgi:hypothetical protein